MLKVKWKSVLIFGSRCYTVLLLTGVLRWRASCHQPGQWDVWIQWMVSLHLPTECWYDVADSQTSCFNSTRQENESGSFIFRFCRSSQREVLCWSQRVYQSAAEGWMNTFTFVSSVWLTKDYIKTCWVLLLLLQWSKNLCNKCFSSRMGHFMRM